MPPFAVPDAATAAAVIDQFLATKRKARAMLVLDVSGSMNGEPIRLWVIQSRLRDQLKTMTARAVLVITDDGVPAGKLVEVVDQARLAGATDVGVATVEEAGAG